MKKRFLFVILASMFGLGKVQALDRSMTQQMWCGLWAGSNFDLSLEAANCQAKNTHQTLPGTKPTYVALGDSVAAGLGLTGSSSNNCGRSTDAYSMQVANVLQMHEQNFACSGATAGDLFTTQHLDGPNNPAQIKQAFQNGRPDLITITVGANDAHWADFIKACYSSNCASDANTRLANAFLVSLQAKLYAALLDVYGYSRGVPPQVILTGYYQAFSDQCAAIQTDITPAELTWLHDETNALNQTISQVAAHFSFAKFAPVDFTGHDICSADSWIQRPGEAASFHPNLAGQTAIAEAVLTKVD